MAGVAGVAGGGLYVAVATYWPQYGARHTTGCCTIGVVQPEF